ncbi:DUF424 family protein [archaeon]|nr:DUF424 family protein [archaeon]
MDKFCYKIFNCGNDVMLAIADSDIVGKKFEEREIEIFVSKDFYCEKECDNKEALRLFKKSTIINAVGKGIIGAMIKEDIIKKTSVIVIDGVPHAQVIAGV